MNGAERFFGLSRMAMRLGSVGLSRRIALARGEEPTRFGYPLLYSHYAEALGIKKGSLKEKHLRRVIATITDFWFKADAILDGESDYGTGSPVGTDEKYKVLDSELNLDPTIPAGIRNPVSEIELRARKKARESHFDFMSTFDPEKSTFQDVMTYRANTTSLLVETIVRVISAISGQNQDVTPILETIHKEALCIQMADDLVDCVDDSRNGRPNLFYALLLENPQEGEKFKASSFSQKIIDSKKPYDIAKLSAPDTLSDYMKIFEDMSLALPKSRKKFVKDCMSSLTCVSFSLHSGIKEVNIAVIREMLARRTVIPNLDPNAIH